MKRELKKNKKIKIGEASNLGSSQGIFNDYNNSTNNWFS